MKSGEAQSQFATVNFQHAKRHAIERGRKISNLSIYLILSCVVTAAAQSERINSSAYKLPRRGAKVTVTILNAP